MGGTPYTPEQNQWLIDRPDLSIQQLEEEWPWSSRGRAGLNLYGRRGILQRTNKIQPKELPLEESRNFEQENHELRTANHSLQRKLADAKTKTAELVEAVHRGAYEAAIIVGAPSVITPTRDRRRAAEEIALLHLTDWQVGKATETYNTEIAAQRVETLTTKVLQLTAIERAAHPVRHCVILLGGDFVEGNLIFPRQPWEVDSTTFAQSGAVQNMLHTLILSLAADFETLDIWGVPGNHGRTGHKGEGPAENNWDAIIYRQLSELIPNPRITWHVTPHWYKVALVGSYRALLIHGDEIKGFSGTPAFAIAKRANNWAAGVLEPFTDMYMGHFHQPLVIPLADGRRRVFMTPSIESGNQYATEFMGALGSPAQRLNFISPKHGRITAERVVYLDDDE